MTRIFTADLGNTRCKLAVFENGNLSLHAEGQQDCERLLNTAGEHDKAVMAVSGNNEIELQIRSRFGGRLKVVSSSIPLPIRIGIENPETLGADRIALACGAAAAFPGQSVLAISLGTCITYNLILPDGLFAGGIISPGIQMRLRAMNHYTTALPLLEPDWQLREMLGKNTAQAMQIGSLEAAAAEINHFADVFSSQNPGMQVVICGGDAQHLASRIKNGIFEPALTMKGLYQIYLTP
jgi:type III pantothenate kinase